MSRTFSDFKELSKAFKPRAAESEKPAAPPSAAQTKDEDVLAYFSRGGASGKDARPSGKAAPILEEAPARPDETASRRFMELERANAALARKIAELENKCAAAEKATARWQGECGRLQDELRKAQAALDESPRSGETPLPQQAAASRVSSSLVQSPPSFAEAFPGEVREMTLAALANELKAAKNGGCERRAAVLGAVLAANPATGELERRRARLKQMLKECGKRNDPDDLKELGFALVNKRTHWRLDYMGVKLTLSKTPSDFRANQNTASDLGNRCY